MTADANSTLGKAADVVLALPQAREACPHNLAPTTSSLMQLALGDALAIALLESRGFTDRDFHVLHPGGRLGALLKFVRDVMRTGAVAAAHPARLAHVGRHGRDVGEGRRLRRRHRSRADRLCGIITDGDLRRHMRPGLTEATVDEIMTKGPKICRSGSTGQRSDRGAQFLEDHHHLRGRKCQARSALCICTISCASASPDADHFNRGGVKRG